MTCSWHRYFSLNVILFYRNLILKLQKKLGTVVFPYLRGMDKITSSIKPFIYGIFFPTFISMIKFNLEIRHSKRLTTIASNEIEQL